MVGHRLLYVTPCLRILKQTLCPPRPSRSHSKGFANGEKHECHTFEIVCTIYDRPLLLAWVREQHQSSSGGDMTSYSRLECTGSCEPKDKRTMVGLFECSNHTGLVLYPSALLRDLRCAFCLVVLSLVVRSCHLCERPLPCYNSSVTSILICGIRRLMFQQQSAQCLRGWL